MSTPISQKTDYLQRVAEKATAVREAQDKRRKTTVADLSRAREKVALLEHNLKRQDYEDALVLDGLAKSYQKYKEETPEQQRNREFGNRIRNWHREIRLNLSGSRLAKGNRSKSVLVFDLIYDKWKRKGRPTEGVAYPFDSLWLWQEKGKDGLPPPPAVPRMPRRTLSRILAKLTKPEREVDEPLIKRVRVGRRVGKGGRDVTRYTFPTFPDRAVFDRDWERTYD